MVANATTLAMKNPSPARISRRTLLATSAGAGAALALPGCVPKPGLSTTAGTAMLTEGIAYRLLQHEPMRATNAGVDSGEWAHLRGRLEDRSAAGQAAYAQTLKSDLANLNSLYTPQETPAMRVTREVIRSAYTTALEGFALPYGDVAVGSWRNGPYPVAQNMGAYIDLPRALDSTHPLKNASDVEAYLARLSQVAAVLDGETGRMQAARAIGVTPPDFMLDKTIAQLGQTIADTGQSGGAWVKPLLVAELQAATTASRQAAQIAEQQIAPALERQLAEMHAARKVATPDAGIGARPHGEAFYDWALKASTTTSLSPEEVHQLGIDTLADIHARMDTGLRALGYTQGNPGQRMLELAKDERFKFAEGDAGRAEIMAFIEERTKWIRAQMPRAFSRLVEAPMEVKRLPPAEEPGAPTAYASAAARDGSRPGVFWINLHTTDLHRMYDIPTLTHHEAIPGHLWENEYSNELPLIRTLLNFNAFSEGWALYSEQLADELGAYDDNPAWRLGYLQDQAYRAVRLVVDTGMHAKGWSRDRAVRYFQENVGKGLTESTNEIDRYCAWPGQACGYMVGKLEMLRQRERAKAALGDAYDMRDFHVAVVEGGNVPLDVLAGNVGRFLGG